MNELKTLKYAPGARHRKRRVGRGPGSGRGKTAGRGHKGLQSRSGGGMHPWSEGGQMPLQRRVPKRGFKNPFRVANEVIHTDDLNRFSKGEIVDPQKLFEAGLLTEGRRIRKVEGFERSFRVKVLAGKRPLETPCKVLAHAFSETAKKEIEAVGGSVEVLEQ